MDLKGNTKNLLQSDNVKRLTEEEKRVVQREMNRLDAVERRKRDKAKRQADALELERLKSLMKDEEVEDAKEN